MAVKTNDINLSDILAEVENGKIQLPEFQRSWVWNDTQICKLIESISSEFPMGAAMFLENGGEAKFKSRLFTGVDECYANVEPTQLVLDGQQRITTLFQVFKCNKPVETCLATNKDAKVYRYYYLDINKCLDKDSDRLDAIASINEKKQLTSNIGREVVLDLSSREMEYKNMMFPLNIVFSTADIYDWMLGFLDYYKEEKTAFLTLYKEFNDKVISKILQYKIPVISLTKDTSNEAVCQIFENVNTGGVPLNVFELVTARFAMGTKDSSPRNLREDWDKISDSFLKRPDHLLNGVSGTSFLTSMTLLVTYLNAQQGQRTARCKKRDVLKLSLDDFVKFMEPLKEGFLNAANFLVHQGVYSFDDLPYTSQLIPLAAILAYDKMNGSKFALQQNIEKLSQWYWCGVMGEQYGSANEGRFALDITGMFTWINGGELPDTVVRGNFQVTRLLSLQTRNSAAYKGIMALIMQDSPLDFMSHSKMDVAAYLKESTDIHHIFPQAYCEQMGYARQKWNSVINKTPIYASTNRSIGGRAPHEYIQTMYNKGLTEQQVKEAIVSHKIDYDLLCTDNFDEFILDRAKKLLASIENAMGKSISGRDSEETIKAFGKSLL